MLTVVARWMFKVRRESLRNERRNKELLRWSCQKTGELLKSSFSVEARMRVCAAAITMERATGIEPVLPAWESDPAALYLQHLHKCLGKLRVHSANAVL